MSTHPWGERFLVHTSAGRLFFRLCQACGALVGSGMKDEHESVCPGVA